MKSCHEDNFDCFGCSIKADIKYIVDSIKYEGHRQRIYFTIPTSFIIVLSIMLSISEATALPESHFGKSSLVLVTTLALSTTFILLNTAYTTYTLSDHTKEQDVNSSDLSPSENFEEMKAKLSRFLSQAIQFKTISYDESVKDSPKTDYNELMNFVSYLKESFPRVFSSEFVEKKLINRYSLLIEWKGKCPLKKPLMFCAHLDVVPVENVKNWDIDNPFSGEIDDSGNIWGRGAIDNKHNVITQLMAVEYLIEQGVTQLDRTVFLAFGHDEEIGGNNGAKKIVDYLLEKYNLVNSSTSENNRNTFEFVFDEGPFLIKSLFPGMKHIPVGLVGCGEKGNVTLKIVADYYPPGHSSMPRTNGETNATLLSRAISKLESNPFPNDSSIFVGSLFGVYEYLPFYLKVLISNIRLFNKLIVSFAENSPALIASMRTTTAVTVVRVGSKVNVVPGKATAYVNHRIHPSIIKDLGIEYGGKKYSEEEQKQMVIQKVIEHDRKIINNSKVKVIYEEGGKYVPCSPITPIDTAQFQTIKKCVRKIFDAPCTSTLMIGNTDTRYYWPLSKNIYRFSPIVFESLEETKMFHGDNERISAENLFKLWQFYSEMLLTYK